MSPSFSRMTWPALTRRLADVLTSLRDGDYLVISQRASNYYVQIAAAGGIGWFAEAVSNTYIETPTALLTVDEYETLKAMGWQRANALPPELVEDDDTDAPRTGSPNFNAHWAPNASTAAIAHMLMRTLREVYRVPAPADLEYSAFVGSGPQIALPTLGLRRQRTQR